MTKRRKESNQKLVRERIYVSCTQVQELVRYIQTILSYFGMVHNLIKSECTMQLDD